MKTKITVAITLGALSGLFGVPLGNAQAPVQRVTLDEALQLFGKNNLELRLARAGADEIQALARQARAFPNPAVTATHETLGQADANYSETYLLLTQRLEWPGQLGARKATAQRSADAAWAGFRADSARLVFEVRRAYVTAAAAEERLEALRGPSEVFRQADASGAARFAAGDLSGYELRRLRIERARYENALASARLEMLAARRHLAALVLPEGEAAEIAPAQTLKGQPPRPRLEEALRVGMERRPDILAATAGVESARSAVRLARLERIPDPALTGGYKRQADGFTGLFLGISLPLPLFDRRGGEIQAGEARLRAVEARLALVRRQVENDIRRAFETYTSLARRAEMMQGQLLAEAGDLLDIAQVSYAEGEMALVELLDAADAFRDARVTSIELVADFWVSYYDLERATGGAFAWEPNTEAQTDEDGTDRF